MNGVVEMLKSDEELIEYYSTRIPVDEELIHPLGYMAWAAVRLHSSLRDVIEFYLRDKPQSDEDAFRDPLGKTVNTMLGLAESNAEWFKVLKKWKAEYGRPAIEARNGIIHSIPYTASDDQKQALMVRKSRDRVTVDSIKHATGLLVLSSVCLQDAVEDLKSRALLSED